MRRPPLWSGSASSCHVPWGKPLSLPGLRRHEIISRTWMTKARSTRDVQAGILWPDHLNMLTALVSPQCSFQDLNLSSLGDGAIQLQVSQQLHHSSFRKVVSVVIAMEKLRNVPIVFSQSLQDEDLRSLFFLIFEEGT